MTTPAEPAPVCISPRTSWDSARLLKSSPTVLTQPCPPILQAPPQRKLCGMPLLRANVAALACLPSLFFTASLGPSGKWPPQPAGRLDFHVPGEQSILVSPPSRDPWRQLLAPFSACSHPGLEQPLRWWSWTPFLLSRLRWRVTCSSTRGGWVNREIAIQGGCVSV